MLPNVHRTHIDCTDKFSSLKWSSPLLLRISEEMSRLCHVFQNKQVELYTYFVLTSLILWIKVFNSSLIFSSFSGYLEHNMVSKSCSPCQYWQDVVCCWCRRSDSWEVSINYSSAYSREEFGYLYSKCRHGILCDCGMFISAGSLGLSCRPLDFYVLHFVWITR